ncbi:MAG: IclR family transcriptional regulator [Hyphomicrobiales bacterium]|nr:IclR family transcriptional regulator [Hyphomicrobiales bacterium]MCP4997978.1 IclR family transcriptional regulator [Hyphomicrobiales bacterium]
MKVKAENQAGVALVAKALTILDMFQVQNPKWSQAELVQATGLNRSTVNRLVGFLASKGYLAQTEPSGRYTLGLAAIELGNRANLSFDLRSICQTMMGKLAADINETVVLTALDRANLSGICIDQIEGRHEGLRVYQRIGSNFPLHAGAAPKAILAYLPQKIRTICIEGELQRFTPNTMVERSELEKDIQATLQRGFALSWEETFEGAVGVAAPILGIDQTAMASIAIAMPIQRAKPELIEKIGKILTSAAHDVSQQLRGMAA